MRVVHGRAGTNLQCSPNLMRLRLQAFLPSIVVRRLSLLDTGLGDLGLVLQDVRRPPGLERFSLRVRLATVEETLEA